MKTRLRVVDIKTSNIKFRQLYSKMLPEQPGNMLPLYKQQTADPPTMSRTQRLPVLHKQATTQMTNPTSR